MNIQQRAAVQDIVDLLKEIGDNQEALSILAKKVCAENAYAAGFLVSAIDVFQRDSYYVQKGVK